MTDEHFMGLALRQAERAMELGEPPFGVVVISAAGEVLAAGHDTVRFHRDWTRHAEIEAVRAACAVHGEDVNGSILFTTVEPCPMCFTAAWLARLSRIVFGATMAEVSVVTRGNQRELSVPAWKINELGPESIALKGGVLRAECLTLFHRPEAYPAT
jgi:tRNA(adenine34) deaminase